MVAIFDELSNAGDDENLEAVQPPNSKVVDWMHGNASTSQQQDIHHRIGFGDTDAAAGSHRHDGRDSQPLFDGDVLLAVGGASTTAELAQAITEIQTLLKGLGAT